jgi:hypothetical protein
LYNCFPPFEGALNASPYNCRIEPNIPIYLIISGILLIVNGSIRIFFYLTSSSNSNKRRRMVRNPSIGGGQRKSQAKGTNYRHLCEYALDGTILFGIMIIVILGLLIFNLQYNCSNLHIFAGCIWVYGASRYMHSQVISLNIFEDILSNFSVTCTRTLIAIRRFIGRPGGA